MLGPPEAVKVVVYGSLPCVLAAVVLVGVLLVGVLLVGVVLVAAAPPPAVVVVVAAGLAGLGTLLGLSIPVFCSRCCLDADVGVGTRVCCSVALPLLPLPPLTGVL